MTHTTICESKEIKTILHPFKILLLQNDSHNHLRVKGNKFKNRSILNFIIANELTQPSVSQKNSEIKKKSILHLIIANLLTQPSESQ